MSHINPLSPPQKSPVKPAVVKPMTPSSPITPGAASAKGPAVPPSAIVSISPEGVDKAAVAANKSSPAGTSA